MPDGRIRVQAHLTRCGVFEYHNPDGSVRRELRLPEEVFNPRALNSFCLAPVTNEHPPVMLNPTNATEYAIGGLGEVITRDDDHVRGDFTVWHDKTIGQMEGGKLDVSCGYTCDLEETPGVHPEYGPYDAIQRNIVGNHLAIVDHGRAGSARARMDSACAYFDELGVALARGTTRNQADRTDELGVPFADQVAVPGRACKTGAMADKADASSPDPDDEASRNAAGKNDPKPGERGKAPPKAENDAGTKDDDGDDEVETDDSDKKDKPDDNGDAEGGDDEDGDGDDDEDEEEKSGDPDDEDEEEDAYDASDIPTDGKLTKEHKAKMAVCNFAVPERDELPIHDPDHVRKSMDAFKDHPFKKADEKHAAYNRILKRGKQFGVSTEQFQKDHSGHLDARDSRSNMDALAKARADHAAAVTELDKTRAKLAAEKARADKAEAALKKARTDAADVTAGAVKARVILLTQVSDVCGARDKDGKPVDRTDMSDRALRLTLIKHVDGVEIDGKESDEYVRAYYESARGRATKDAEQTEKGAAAIAGARATVEQHRADASKPGLDDEATAYRRMRERSINAWDKTPQGSN